MNRKKIDLFAPPFSGHLHPILAMARQLKQEFDVRIICSPGAQATIHSAGLIGISLQSVNDKELLDIVNPPHAVGSNPIKLHRQFKDVLRILSEVNDEISTLYESEQPDLIIADFTLPVVGILAVKKNIDWWTSIPSPCVIEDSSGAPAYLGGLKEATNYFGKVRNWSGRKLIRLFKSAVFFLYRDVIRKIGLLQLYREDGSEAIYSSQRILCLGLPALEFSKSWPVSARFIGPMLYTPPVVSRPPVFVAGKKYVLVSLGTHLHWHKDEVANEIKKISAMLPDLVFHFSDGRSDRESKTYQDFENFHRFPYVDYDQFLENYSLVIHHGGAGIMYHCLQHAIPAIVYPVDYDQFDHAARLESAGVALWIKQLDQLQSAIVKLFASTSIALRCKSYSVELTTNRSENILPAMVREYFEKVSKI